MPPDKFIEKGRNETPAVERIFVENQGRSTSHSLVNRSSPSVRMKPSWEGLEVVSLSNFVSTLPLHSDVDEVSLDRKPSRARRKHTRRKRSHRYTNHPPASPVRFDPIQS